MVNKIILWGSGIILMLFIVNTCSYCKNVKLLIGGKLMRNNFIQEIPFEYRKDLIVIKAQINDDSTLYEFIFDTGAFNSKVEKNLAEQLDLPTITTKSNSTAQGITQRIEVTCIQKLTLGKTTFKNIGAGKVDYDKKSASPCIAAAGLLGANLIKLAHWKIDYKNQILYCSDQPFLFSKNQEVSNFSFDRPLLSGTPKIDLEIENKNIKNILFDVGYNGGLILPASFASSFHQPPYHLILDESTTGIYGTNLDTLITKNLNVNLANKTVKIPVTFSTLGKALLGNDFLEHFIVYIDYNKNHIQLQNVDSITIDSSLSFVPNILNDSLWTIGRTPPNSFLDLGDTILTINGFRPVDIFPNHCDYVHGIRQFLSTDSLEIKLNDGQFLFLLNTF